MERNASLLDGSETWKTSQLQNNTESLNRSWQRGDDEHGLIARYAAKLAENQKDPRSDPESSSASAHQLLAQLETKNQEILREIARIRYALAIIFAFNLKNVDPNSIDLCTVTNRKWMKGS